jgi:CrcB protein
LTFVVPRTSAEPVAVFCGGIVGTALRWGIDSLIPHTSEQFPTSTLIVNVTGSFILAYLVGGLWERPLPHWLKVGVGPGVLGTFTTFSAVAIALVTLTATGHLGLAVLYLVLTLVFGFAAVWAGFYLSGAIHPASPGEEVDE